MTKTTNNVPSETINSIADCSITKVRTGQVINDLHTMFKIVTSGEPYNKDQIRSAALLTNAMIKGLRFEFDVFKYFDARVNTQNK